MSGSTLCWSSKQRCIKIHMKLLSTILDLSDCETLKCIYIYIYIYIGSLQVNFHVDLYIFIYIYVYIVYIIESAAFMSCLCEILNERGTSE